MCVFWHWGVELCLQWQESTSSDLRKKKLNWTECGKNVAQKVLSKAFLSKKKREAHGNISGLLEEKEQNTFVQFWNVGRTHLL